MTDVETFIKVGIIKNKIHGTKPPWPSGESNPS